MSVQDDYIAILRETLGEGYELATLPVLMKTFTARTLYNKVLTRRIKAIDNNSLVASREIKERALQVELEARAAAEAAVAAQLNTDLEGF